MSASPSHPLKRKRLDDSEGDKGETKGTTVVQSSGYWFDDGTVVLQVENTQFCVHRGILCLQSKIMQDMFSTPQPDGEETVDGRPLVHLYDKPDDWENVFGVLYHRSMSHYNPTECAVDVLISILRISHKYMLDDMKSTVVRRLKKQFPTSSYDWATLQTRYMNTLPIRGYEIDLINVVLEVKLDLFLPVLYYHFLAAAPVVEIFDGVTRKDGTVARLEPAIQRILNIGRHAIFEATSKHSWNWVTKYHNDHLDSCCVEKQLRTIQFSFIDFYDRFSGALKSSGGAEALVQEFEFCTTCAEYIEEEMEEGYRNLWQELPSYFELPSWDDLRKCLATEK